MFLIRLLLEIMFSTDIIKMLSKINLDNLLG